MSKGFLRVLGTSIGGALGLLVMFNTRLATKAVPLAVILVVCTFLAGVASHSPFKVRKRVVLDDVKTMRAACYN